MPTKTAMRQSSVGKLRMREMSVSKKAILPAGSYPVHISFAILIPSKIPLNRFNPFFIFIMLLFSGTRVKIRFQNERLPEYTFTPIGQGKCFG